MLGGGFCFLWDKVKYVEVILILYFFYFENEIFMFCQVEGNLNNLYSKMSLVF